VESKGTTLNLIEGSSIALLFKMRWDNYGFDFMSISMVQPNEPSRFGLGCQGWCQD
jgi:hypothetical protein